MGDKWLIVLNRPVHIMYFYSLWNEVIVSSCRDISFFVNQSYLNYLDRFKACFDFPVRTVYTFEEPRSASYYNSVLPRLRDLAKNFFTYFRMLESIRAIPLTDFENLLTFADDMLHFQYLISLYKNRRNDGIVYLADEGLGLYHPVKRRSLIREVVKRLIFPDYLPVLMGCNPLVDTTLARFPEKANCSQSKSTRKISYQITDREDLDKWCDVFRVDATVLTDLRESHNRILFLGTPFEEVGISHSKIIKFLCAVREFTGSDIIIKPHPKEDVSLYTRHFNVLPSDLPAEILLAACSFRFVLGYISSALLEARLYGHRCYYVEVSGDSTESLHPTIFEHLGVKRYSFKEGVAE